MRKINKHMSKRPLLPNDFHKIAKSRDAFLHDQRSDVISQKVSQIRGSLKQINQNELDVWDIEALKMIDDVLQDERVAQLRREIKSLMKSAGKDYEIEKELWQRRKKRK